jgi:hypothetical protein
MRRVSRGESDAAAASGVEPACSAERTYFRIINGYGRSPQCLGLETHSSYASFSDRLAYSDNRDENPPTQNLAMWRNGSA